MKQISGQAWFVSGADSIGDLMQPHYLEEEQPYEVVKRIVLSKMEYGNFVTDLYADRRFLEKYADECSIGTVFHCLLVQQRGKPDGVLVVPYDQSYVNYAAYYPGDAPGTEAPERRE